MRTLENILADANSFLDLEAATPTGTELGIRVNFANQAVLDAGFYVIWGICVGQTGANYTQAYWDNFVSVSQTLAAWAQTLNNANFEFSIGNEDDDNYKVAGSAFTASQVRTNLLTQATAVQAIYTAGPVSYQATQGEIDDWALIGIGDLDKIGFNCYDTLANFNSNIALVFSTFGADGYISEWGDQTGYTTTSNENRYDKNVRDRLAILKASDIGSAYFFTYNHTAGTYGLTDGQWNLLNEDYVTLRTAVQTLTGGRRWFL